MIKQKHTLRQGEDSAMKNAHGGCMERRFLSIGAYQILILINSYQNERRYQLVH